MRKFYAVLLLTIMIAMVAGCSKKPTDLTYTTKSTQARDFYLQGLEKSDNFLFAEARDMFSRAVDADPEFAMAYYQWAQVTTNATDFLEKLNKAVDLSGKAPEAERLIIMSAQALNDNDVKKAEDDIIKALNIYPNGKRLRYMLGNFYYSQQNFAAAETEYRKTIAIDSAFAPVYNILAYLLTNLNRYDEAIEQLKKYVELRPTDPNPHDSMGEIYLYMGNHDKSIEEYNSSLRLDSTFVISLAGLGHNHVFRGDFASARGMYDQIKARAATTADTNTSMFWNASSYCHEGNFAEAIKMLEAQLAFDKAHDNLFMQAVIFGQFGEIYRETGDYRKAMAAVAMERALAANPRITAAAREGYLLDALMTESISYAKMGMLDSANLKLAEYRVLAGKSSNQNTAGNLNLLEGVIALYTKDFENAIGELSQANINDPIALYYRALAYEQAGRGQEAMVAFDALAKMNRNSLSYGIVRPWAAAKTKQS